MAMRKLLRMGWLGVLTLTAGWVSPALSQGASVWNGVYTDAQAERGAVKYRQECVMCHGPDLEGNGEAPPLTGRFIPDWEGTKLSELFEKIQATMPLFAPATLSAPDTADLLAFILRANNFPQGSRQLEPGDSLERINFDARRPAKAEPDKRR